jgi:hypothetical protein
MAAIIPPNATIAFVQAGAAQSLVLTAQAFRFLTNICAAINGTTASGVSQNVLGNGVTISAGSGSPNGRVAGNIGDLYVNTNGGSGQTLWVKESSSGLKVGWGNK